MLEISDYQTLIALIEEGGVIQASKVLNRVPSAVSARLQLMESNLGAPLFLREKKRLKPTGSAITLYGEAKRIVELSREAELRAKNQCPGGRFRLGALESMVGTRLPGPLATLIHKFPDIKLELQTGISSTLLENLQAGNLDAVFVVDPPEDERFESADIFREKLVFIAKEGHPPIRTPKDVRDDTMLAFKDGCSYRSRLFRWFAGFRDVPRRVVEMTSYHGIIGGVSAGMGVGIVPLPILETFPAREVLSIHPIEGPIADATTQLLWRKNLQSPNIQALRSCIEGKVD